MSEPNIRLPQGGRTDSDLDAVATAALRVPARPACLALVGTVVQWFGRQAGLSEKRCQELEVAVDEACTNVIRHAFPPATNGEMTIACSASDRGLEVTVQDKGKPFNPKEGVEIAREKRSRDLASGGMGLLLIDQLTDAVRYRWDEREGNQFTLVKHK